MYKKKLTDADLGWSQSSNQTHIGLHEDMLLNWSPSDTIYDAYLFVEGNPECYVCKAVINAIIDGDTGQPRSPKIKTGNIEEAINLNKLIKDKATSELRYLSLGMLPNHTLIVYLSKQDSTLESSFSIPLIKDTIESSLPKPLINTDDRRDFALEVFKELIRFTDGITKLSTYLTETKSQQEKYSLPKYGFSPIFICYPKKSTDVDLTSSGKKRFFSDPVFSDSCKNWYLSCEWNFNSNSNLRLEDLQKFVNEEYKGYYYIKLSEKSKLPEKRFQFFRLYKTAIQLPKPCLLLSGPPGTGKSYKLNQQLKELKILNEDGSQSKEQAQQTLRVIGHPELTNAQFIGSYRPNMKADALTYSFSPGPFTKLLYKALRHPNQPYVLIIEELNRTNAAAMFAEAFQLLDRATNGWSEYATDLGDDVLKYLKDENKSEQTSSEDKSEQTPSEDKSEQKLSENVRKKLEAGVKLPPNFAIWATMNTADQGVFPMDTAFKRRWSFEYLGVNEGRDTWGEAPWNPEIYEQEENFTWQALRTYINTLLEAQGVDESRQLGGFFLSKAELSDKDKLLEHIINKVIGYLRDDVMRYEPEKLFKAVEGGTRAPSFSQLRTTLLKAKNGDDFLDIFAVADGQKHSVDKVREIYKAMSDHLLHKAATTQPTAQDEEQSSESATSEQAEG